MAYNVFGNPVTNSTLEGLPQYEGRPITRLDRARVALLLKNAENKDKNAREYVENLKRQWGNGVSTLCLVYNATGDTIRFVRNHDWWGHIGPAPFPIQIGNGQWGGYLHVKKSGAASGSVGAVVYRGLNNNGASCDWLGSWSNPWFRPTQDNKAFTEVRQGGNYDQNNRWNDIYSSLNKSGLYSKDTWNGCVSTVTTGSATTALFEAIYTLENADY